MAFWHALAKLRLHTESTLKILDSVTTTMGDTTRKFTKAVEDSGLEVYELPNEEVVRTRRVAVANAKGKGKAKAIKTGAKRKYLNLSTFKWHNCGHLAAAIRRFGTADGFTTQTVRFATLAAAYVYTDSALQGRTGTPPPKEALSTMPQAAVTTDRT